MATKSVNATSVQWSKIKGLIGPRPNVKITEGLPNKDTPVEINIGEMKIKLDDGEIKIDGLLLQ
jgi:hypothetical protein